jgi:hypothetical protein
MPNGVKCGSHLHETYMPSSQNFTKFDIICETGGRQKRSSFFRKEENKHEIDLRGTSSYVP